MHEELLKKATVISPKQFLRYFLPLENCETELEVHCDFDSLGYLKSSERMFATITSMLNETEVCPGYTFISMPSRQIDSSAAVIGAICPAARAPKPSRYGEECLSSPVDWADIEVCIVCTADLFGDPFGPVDPDCASDTDYRATLLELICTCAEKVYESQQRASQFMLLLLGTGARFLWFDRSGAVVSRRFDYRSQPPYLSKFLRRFSRLGLWGRGHDDTAERVAHDSTWGFLMMDVANKRSEDPNTKYALEQFKRSLSPSASWWCLTVKDELAEEGDKEGRFLVGQSHFIARDVFGSGSRGYVALDVESADTSEPKLVYLKDTWRVVHEDLQEEGATLQILNILGVPYIPTVLCHGDLDQVTPSREVWQRHHPGATSETHCPFKTLSHYRLVTREVGRPLKGFQNSKELIDVVFYCVKAHSQAYEAGIIHRDISANNMLIYTDERGYVCGLLDDWEVSRFLPNNHLPEEEALHRVGTWQFLSVAAQDDPGKTIDLQDELESFFHVILYTAIRLLPHNCPNPAALLYNYFDAYLPLADGEYKCGLTKRLAITEGRLNLNIQGFRVRDPLTFRGPSSNGLDPEPHPMNKLIDELLSWFAAYYRVMYAELPPDAPIPHTHAKTSGPEEPVDVDVLPLGLLQELDKDESIREARRRRLARETQFPTPPRDNDEDAARTRSLAGCLNSHADLLDRLRRFAKSTECPVADELRAEMYDPNDIVPSPSPPPSMGGPDNAASNSSSSNTANPVPAAHLDPEPNAPAVQEMDVFNKDGAPLAASGIQNRKRASTDVDGLEPPAVPSKRVQRG